MLELVYSVFPKEDVITRSAKFINKSDKPVRLTRLMSMQLDLNRSSYVVTSFHGGWTKEMNRYDTTVNIGKFVNASYTGSSSNRCNPFIMVSEPDTSETMGDCYGFNLVYSGNHYEAVEVNSFEKDPYRYRYQSDQLCLLLAPGESLSHLRRS